MSSTPSSKIQMHLNKMMPKGDDDEDLNPMKKPIANIAPPKKGLESFNPIVEEMLMKSEEEEQIQSNIKMPHYLINNKLESCSRYSDYLHYEDLIVFYVLLELRIYQLDVKAGNVSQNSQLSTLNSHKLSSEELMRKVRR